MKVARVGLTLLLVSTLGLEIGFSQNTLPDSGNVGIGTQSPAYLLDVAGQGFMENILLTERIQTNGETDQYNLVIGQHAQGASVGSIGKGIGFTALNSDVSYIGTDVRAAINPVLSGGIVSQIGLTFFTHPSSSGSDPLVEAARFDHMGRFMIGTTDSEGYLFNLNGTSQFKDNIKLNGHLGIGKAAEPSVDISIKSSSPVLADKVLELYDSDDVLRTEIRNTGFQMWVLQDPLGKEKGRVEISYPGIPNFSGEPGGGLVFFDSLGTSRTQIVHMVGGGLVFGAHTEGAPPPEVMRLDADGRLSLGIDDAEGFLLNINGTSQFKDTVVVSGNVGIGTSSPTSKLAVNGTTKTKEIIVTEQASEWPDYVFEETGGPRLKLGELETFINEHRHLPGIPTKAQIERDGQNLGAIQAKLLEKIEELTLHVIEMNGEIEALKSENKQLRELITTALKSKN